MDRKRKLNIGGREVEVTEVGFRSSGENWNEYITDDGTVLRVKLVVTDIYRLDGQYDQHGNPVHFVQSTNVLSVSAPDDKRKRNE